MADVSRDGKDISRSQAKAEREELSIRPQPKDPEAERIARLKKKGVSLHPITKSRLRVSAEARRKPIPSMWLANHECRVALAAAEKEKAMSPKERAEKRAEKLKAAWTRVKARQKPERQQRGPLKYPANH